MILVTFIRESKGRGLKIFRKSSAQYPLFSAKCAVVRFSHKSPFVNGFFSECSESLAVKQDCNSEACMLHDHNEMVEKI